MRDDVSFKTVITWLSCTLLILLVGVTVSSSTGPQTVDVNGCTYEVKQDSTGTVSFEHSCSCHRETGVHLLTKN